MRPAALLLLAAILAGCAGRTSYGVEISDERPFTPSTLSITAGTTVVFKNTSTTPQTVTADPQSKNEGTLVKLPDGAAALESGVLYPGETTATPLKFPALTFTSAVLSKTATTRPTPRATGRPTRPSALFRSPPLRRNAF